MEKMLMLAAPSSALGVAAVNGSVPHFFVWVAAGLLLVSLGFLAD